MYTNIKCLQKDVTDFILIITHVMHVHVVSSQEVLHL